MAAVAFDSVVSISKCFIKAGVGWDDRPKSWIAEASFDNKTWKTVDERSGVVTGGNTEIFNTNSPVDCKYFRLTFSSTSSRGSYCFAFSHFDCLTSIENAVKKRNNYSCNRKRNGIPYFVILYSFCILFK